jgi:uncharacterized membrane protein YvlD (DUF360 family)
LRTPWPFGAALAVLTGLGWALSSSPAVRMGLLASAVASAVVLGLKAVAVRRSLKTALGMSVGGLVLRVVAWAVGYGWIRARGGDVGGYTLGYFALFVVALCLEVTYVLVAAGVQRRGRGEV